MSSTCCRAGDEPAMNKEMKRSWQKAQSLPSKQTGHTVYLRFAIKMHCIDTGPWLLSQ